jgi:hypothetical protein
LAVKEKEEKEEIWVSESRASANCRRDKKDSLLRRRRRWSTISIRARWLE